MDRSRRSSLDDAIMQTLIDVLATSLDRGDVASAGDVARQLEERLVTSTGTYDESKEEPP